MESRATAGETTQAQDDTIYAKTLTVIHQELVQLAQETIPGIKTFKIPTGFQVEKGPDAVVELIKENLPNILGASSKNSAAL